METKNKKKVRYTEESNGGKKSKENEFVNDDKDETFEEIEDIAVISESIANYIKRSQNIEFRNKCLKYLKVTSLNEAQEVISSGLKSCSDSKESTFSETDSEETEDFSFQNEADSLISLFEEVMRIDCQNDEGNLMDQFKNMHIESESDDDEEEDYNLLSKLESVHIHSDEQAESLITEELNVKTLIDQFNKIDFGTE